MHAVGIYHNSFPYRNVIVSHSIILQSYSNMMTFISCIVIVAESGGFLYELLIQTSLVNQHILWQETLLHTIILISSRRRWSPYSSHKSNLQQTKTTLPTNTKINTNYKNHKHSTMKIFQLLISIALGALPVYTAKATPLENSNTHEEGTRRLGQSHHQTVDFMIKDATQLNTNTKESSCNAACQTCKFGCDMAIDVGPCETNCWM